MEKVCRKRQKAAENFAKAATECKVKRIVYLGGLIHEDDIIINSKREQIKISEHMQSRIEVGKILKTLSAYVTIFRATVILGKDGASYKMLRYLVDPDTLRYIDMMKRYAKVINKKFLKIIIIPFLTPMLSSYWVELITPTKASLVRPLIKSLKYEAVVKDDPIKNIIPIRLNP